MRSCSSHGACAGLVALLGLVSTGAVATEPETPPAPEPGAGGQPSPAPKQSGSSYFKPFESVDEVRELVRTLQDKVAESLAEMRAAVEACDVRRWQESNAKLDLIADIYVHVLQQRGSAGPFVTEIDEARNAALADFASDPPQRPPLPACPEPTEDILSEIPDPEPLLSFPPKAEPDKTVPVPLEDILGEIDATPNTTLPVTRDVLRKLAQPPAPVADPPKACPPPGRSPIEVGPNGKVGSGARLKSKAASTALGMVGGLLGNGRGGGGRGGPELVRCRIKDAETTVFSDPETGLALRVGAKQAGDTVTLYTGIDNAPDAGTFQSAFLQDPGGDVMAPSDVGICDLWGEWSLTVSWTKSTYVDGQLVKRESGGWGKEGIFTIPGMLSPDGRPDGLWRRLGFSNASHGARRIATVFPVTAAQLAEAPVDFVAHVTRPSQDPVTTVPFALRMRSTPAGITFERVEEACEPPAAAVVVEPPRPVLVTQTHDPDGTARCPNADPCEELERRYARTLDLRRHLQEELAARTAEGTALQSALDAAEAALRDAEQAVADVGAVPKNESWIQDAQTGRRIDSRDLRLRRAASQAAWKRYKAGEITAQELEAEWGRLGEDRVLDELRKEDEQQRAERTQAAEQARDAARRARDEAQAKHDAAERSKAELQAAIAELGQEADLLFEQLVECKKKGCEPEPPPLPPATPEAEGGGTEPPAPPAGTPETPPPASGTPEEQADPCYCGPDMTAAMTETMNRLQERIALLPSSEKGIFDGPLFLNRNGDSFDSPPGAVTRPDAPESASAPDSWLCPSPKCAIFKTRTSAMLCGYCLPFHMFNEINASFVASGTGVPLMVFLYGANAREYLNYDVLEGNVPTIAYDIGYRLQDLAEDGAPLTADSVCDLVAGVMELRTPISIRGKDLIPDLELGWISQWDLVLLEYPHLKDCGPCPNPAPGRYVKDFSRNLWTLDDDTRVGEEYEPEQKGE